MEDVQDLFRLCRFAAWLGCGIALLGGMAAHRKLHWRAFRCTLLAVLAAVTVVVILAVIDFNRLFVLFHKIAFTNDLWLLNPRTDLLIRLMPIEFFVSYAAIIGVCWLVGMALLLTGSTILIRKCKRNKGE